MTRRMFGGLDGAASGHPPRPRHPREDLDDGVAAALEAHYEAEELDQLAELVRHFVTGDEDSLANRLHAQLAAAAAAARVPDQPAPQPVFPPGYPAGSVAYAGPPR